MSALSSPLRQIAENAGQEGAIILQQVEKLPDNHGYNALTDRVCRHDQSRYSGSDESGALRA